MGRGPGISACGAQGTSPEHKRRLCKTGGVFERHRACGGTMRLQAISGFGRFLVGEA
jgi:hypothetical protein